MGTHLSNAVPIFENAVETCYLIPVTDLIAQWKERHTKLSVTGMAGTVTGMTMPVTGMAMPVTGLIPSLLGWGAWPQA